MTVQVVPTLWGNDRWSSGGTVQSGRVATLATLRAGTTSVALAQECWSLFAHIHFSPFEKGRALVSAFCILSGLAHPLLLPLSKVEDPIAYFANICVASSQFAYGIGAGNMSIDVGAAIYQTDRDG